MADTFAENHVAAMLEENRRLQDRCDALTEENARMFKVNAENSGLRWQLDVLRGFLRGLLPHLTRSQVRDAEKVALDLQKGWAVEGERRPWQDLLKHAGV